MPIAQLKTFNSQVQRSLFVLQMIEEALKVYIADAHEVIRGSIPAGICFNVDVSRYEDASLERLITYFAMFSSNRDLIRRLNRLRVDRNFCAHRAFAVGFMKEVTGQTDLRAETLKVGEIEAAAFDALELLQTEGKAMRALRSRATRPRMTAAPGRRSTA